MVQHSRTEMNGRILAVKFRELQTTIMDLVSERHLDLYTPEGCQS